VKVELPEDKLKAGMKERLVASLVAAHEATEARSLIFFLVFSPLCIIVPFPLLLSSFSPFSFLSAFFLSSPFLFFLPLSNLSPLFYSVSTSFLCPSLSPFSHEATEARSRIFLAFIL